MRKPVSTTPGDVAPVFDRHSRDGLPCSRSASPPCVRVARHRGRGARRESLTITRLKRPLQDLSRFLGVNRLVDTRVPRAGTEELYRVEAALEEPSCRHHPVPLHTPLEREEGGIAIAGLVVPRVLLREQRLTLPCLTLTMPEAE